MSDVFFLQLRRKPAEVPRHGFLTRGGALGRQEGLCPRGLPSEDRSGLGCSRTNFPVIVAGLVSVGAVVSIGVKLWELRRKRPDSTGQHARRVAVGRGRVSPAPRNVPPPREKARVVRTETESDGETSSFLQRFRRIEMIGKGGFGVVFKCLNLETGEVVAVKEMPAEGSMELESEYRLLMNIRHPHIIRLLDFEVATHHARLYLEWAAGGSLRDMIKEVKVMPEELARVYVRQIVSALECLHAHAIIHRDIKPQNVLVDHTGVLKVTDFGLSRHTPGEATAIQTMCAGTPRYMAPENLNGEYHFASDMWAVGATMSEMLTGQLPWSHLPVEVQCNMQLLLFHISCNPNNHPIIPTTLSQEGQDFMRRCFAPNPRDRGTATDLLGHPFLIGPPAGVAASPHGSSGSAAPPEVTAPTLATGGVGQWTGSSVQGVMIP